MNEEEQIAQDCRNQEDETKGPDNEGEGHGTQNQSLLIILVVESPDLLKEPGKRVLNSGFLNRQLTVVDGDKSESVNDLTRC